MTLLENYFIFLQKHPKMFSLNDDATNKRIKELYDSKVVFPLTPRDEKGRRGFLIQLKYINAKTINITDLNALSFRSSFYMLEEEETQIAGIFYMIDFSDTNMSELFCKISLLELKEMCESIVHSMPGRFKGIYLINVPQAAQFLVEIIKLTASKKLRDRIILLKNHNEFKNHFSMKIMPKELGGEIPEAEMIEEFRGIMKQNEEANKMIYDFKIDSNEMFQFEKPGSFRTLNID